MPDLSFFFQEEEDSILPPVIALSSEHLTDEGVFLLENGEDALIYVGGMVNPEILHKLFGSPSLEGVPSQVIFSCIYCCKSKNNFWYLQKDAFFKGRNESLNNFCC